MEQLVIACLSTAMNYLNKSVSGTLTEFEVLLYEQCSRTATAYLKSIENSFRMGMIEQERELHKKLEDDNKKGGDEDGEVTPVPEG